MKPASEQGHLENAELELPQAIDKALVLGSAVQMRSTLDDLPMLKAIRMYWRIALICMLAAFSAALDGYQVSIASSIVSNKGFIRIMSGGGTEINPTHVAVWGGMLSTGQLVGVGFLQMAIDTLGRKIAMHITWVTLCISVALGSTTSNWLYWLFAKLIGGAGLGMMQATYPLYISEHSPTQIRGLLTTSYMFWYVTAQIFAPLALRQLALSDPYDFKTPIYTQWGMLGVLLLINIGIPESPWWLAQRDRHNEAEAVLRSTHKGVPGYDSKTEMAIIVATIEQERILAASETQSTFFQIFKGINLWRLFIAFWPKAMQQLAGQSVTNNYGTYFFQLAGNSSPFTVTIILAVCQLAGVLTTSLVSDKLGRRWLTLGLFGSGTLAIFAIGILGSFDFQDKELGSALVFFACLSNFGVIGGAGIAYSYVVEIPNQRLRARTTAVALMGSFCLGLIFNYTVPLMLKAWSVQTGYFFGGTGFISCVVGYFVLPEIACRTPAEIDEMFEDKIAPRKFRAHITQVQTFLGENQIIKQVDAKGKVNV
ncbi:general substrate transporter [Penicillium angulare]|uniref:General substrate transporter n=1 Tax=Penicillium angulare TaxID=116970 RepID=A0A9W9GDW6_9EURO|nr:general substrate transporter [Penicillium angulare]